MLGAPAPNFPPGGWDMAQLTWYFRTFLGQVLSWFGEIFDLVMSQKALLIIVVAIPIISFGFGLFHRLKNS